MLVPRKCFTFVTIQLQVDWGNFNCLSITLVNTEGCGLWWLHVSYGTTLLKFEYQKLLANDNIFIPFLPSPPHTHAYTLYEYIWVNFLSHFSVHFHSVLDLICVCEERTALPWHKLIKVFNPLKSPVQNNRLAGQAVTGIQRQKEGVQNSRW